MINLYNASYEHLFSYKLWTSYYIFGLSFGLVGTMNDVLCIQSSMTV
jgi:hypothetical protein